MGRREPKSSRSEKMILASLLRPFSFMDVLNACMLMIITWMSGDWANSSSRFRFDES